MSELRIHKPAPLKLTRRRHPTVLSEMEMALLREFLLTEKLTWSACMMQTHDAMGRPPAASWFVFQRRYKKFVKACCAYFAKLSRQGEQVTAERNGTSERSKKQIFATQRRILRKYAKRFRVTA